MNFPCKTFCHVSFQCTLYVERSWCFRRKQARGREGRHRAGSAFILQSGAPAPLPSLPCASHALLHQPASRLLITSAVLNPNHGSDSSCEQPASIAQGARCDSRAGPGRVAGARVQAPWLVDSAGCTWTLALSDAIIVCGMYPAAIGRSTFLLHKAGL